MNDPPDDDDCDLRNVILIGDILLTLFFFALKQYTPTVRARVTITSARAASTDKTMTTGG